MYMYFLLCLYGVFTANARRIYDIKAEYDLCSPKTQSVVYLPNVGDHTHVRFSMKDFGQQCNMQFETCRSCQLKVNISVPSFQRSGCFDQRFNKTISSNCMRGCNYIHFWDPDYPAETSSIVDTFSNPFYFITQSRNLKVKACFDYSINPFRPFSNSFMLNVTEKVQLMYGEAYHWFPQSFIESPYFPSPYVMNSEIYTYKFRSNRSTDFITIMFEDWIVSMYSEFEVTGSNIVGTFSGKHPRPYIISDGSEVTITFRTGISRWSEGNSLYNGFRAIPKFYGSRYEIPNIKTDCGETVSSLGGTINLGMKADGQVRDCIWVIRPVDGYSGIYLKVIRYKKDYSDHGLSEHSLEVRGGLNSLSDLRLKMIPSPSNLPHYSAQQSTKGFYVRLKGSYYEDDMFLVAYAPYTFDCDGRLNFFQCGNGLCIPEHLMCDLADHCGDNSDETAWSCDHPTDHPKDRESSTAISISVVIPMVVSVVLIVFLCLLIIFIRRYRRLNNRTFGNCAATSQNNRDRRHRRRNREVQMSVTVSSGDHPPSYDEVLQSTPIGYLNMAFSWCPSQSRRENGLSEPPSYEEAVIQYGMPSDSSSVPTSTNWHSDGNLNDINSQQQQQQQQPEQQQQQQQGQHLHTGSVGPRLAFSLDMNYVSSSSSSDDMGDNRLNISSTTDTSTDNEGPMTPASFGDDVGQSVDSGGKDLWPGSNVVRMGSPDAKTGRNKFKEENAVQVQLGAPTSMKQIDEMSGSVVHSLPTSSSYGERISDSRRGGDRHTGDTERKVTRGGKERGELRENEARAESDALLCKRGREEERYRMEPDSDDTSDERGRGWEAEALLPAEKTPGRREKNEREEGQPPERTSTPERGLHEGHKSPQHCSESHSAQNYEKQRTPRRFEVGSEHRSLSYADLSLQLSGAEAVDQDKRFSYAGAGDLPRRSKHQDPYNVQRSLVRREGLQSLHQFPADSSERKVQSTDGERLKPRLQSEGKNLEGKRKAFENRPRDLEPSKKNVGEMEDAFSHPSLSTVPEALHDGSFGGNHHNQHKTPKSQYNRNHPDSSQNIQPRERRDGRNQSDLNGVSIPSAYSPISQNGASLPDDFNGYRNMPTKSNRPRDVSTNSNMPTDSNRHRDMPPDSNRRRDMPPDSNRRRDMPPEYNRHRDMPPESNRHRDMPPESNRRRDMPPESNRRRDMPPKSNRRRDMPPEYNRHRDMPPESNRHRDMPPESNRHRDSSNDCSNPPGLNRHIDARPDTKRQRDTVSDSNWGMAILPDYNRLGDVPSTSGRHRDASNSETTSRGYAGSELIMQIENPEKMSGSEQGLRNTRGGLWKTENDRGQKKELEGEAQGNDTSTRATSGPVDEVYPLITSSLEVPQDDVYV